MVPAAMMAGSGQQCRLVTRMKPRHPPTRPVSLLCVGLLAAALLSAPAAGAQSSSSQSMSCEQEGKNTQCNDLGSIAMDTQREIRGEPIKVEIDATIDDTLAERGARYVMFSVRHDGSDSPVSLSLEKFSTRQGTIFTERIDHDIPNEINIWAHVADIPEGEPIKIVLNVGASDRGAFRLETLVMPFDRGYEPVRGRGGAEVTLFSFTMLGVNKESSDVSKGASSSIVDRVRTPGLGSAALLSGLLAAAAVAARRGRQ